MCTTKKPGLPVQTKGLTMGLRILSRYLINSGCHHLSCRRSELPQTDTDQIDHVAHSTSSKRFLRTFNVGHMSSMFLSEPSRGHLALGPPSGSLFLMVLSKTTPVVSWRSAKSDTFIRNHLQGQMSMYMKIIRSSYVCIL